MVKELLLALGGFKYFTCAYILIYMIKESGCKLPIEVGYYNNELSNEMKLSLENLGATCNNIADYINWIPKEFLMKPLAIMYSSFREVLFLDADNNCLKDPTYLFSDPNYLIHGSLFWPDYWDTCPDHPTP